MNANVDESCLAGKDLVLRIAMKKRSQVEGYHLLPESVGIQRHPRSVLLKEHIVSDETQA